MAATVLMGQSKEFVHSVIGEAYQEWRGFELDKAIMKSFKEAVFEHLNVCNVCRINDEWTVLNEDQVKDTLRNAVRHHLAQNDQASDTLGRAVCHRYARDDQDFDTFERPVRYRLPREAP